MDPGFYGLIKDGNAIGGEEHNALEVFELAEEDCRTVSVLLWGVEWVMDWDDAYWQQDCFALFGLCFALLGRRRLRR